GLDPAKMARLPDTTGMKNEVVMVRSQRNQYDHAIRSAGVHIVEVGLPDRVAGAGVRDAEPRLIAAAVTEAAARRWSLQPRPLQALAARAPPFRARPQPARQTRIP
ncbi:MAG: hypothetical protein ACQSGP_31970, partial [Frankia sp.]